MESVTVQSKTQFVHYRQKDTHPNMEGLFREAKELAAKILEIAKLQQSKLDRTVLQRRKLKALMKTMKNLRINSKKMAAGDHDFIPLFYIWTMTNNCNFNCSYCSNHRGDKYPDLFKNGLTQNLTTEQGKDLLRRMSASSAIYFCGGEPTIRKDLPELLEYSTKLNMFNMINTNGSLIGDLLLKPGYENFLYNMDVVIVSLDSLCVPKLADMYEVSEKISRNVLRNLLALQILQKHIPFNLAANTVITKDTIEDTFDILDFCNDLGVKFSPIAANIGHEPDWELLNNPRYRELVDKIIERSAKYPMIASGKMLKSILLPTKMTCYPTVFDHVDYDGGVFWPCKAYLKGIKPNIFDYDSIIDLHRAASQIINPKDFHGDGENQCKGHCQWMQDCVTSFYGKALKEGFRRSGVLKEILGLIK